MPLSTSSMNLPADNLSADSIPHFDATERRKEKMRRKASQGTPRAKTETQPVAVSPAPVAPAPVVPAPVVAVAPQSTGTGLSGEALEKYLVNFVVEQTGYPEEMVELDADLEADLGIDSIKKAQLFGELANEFDIQTSEDLSLDDFLTLRDVKAFLEAAPQTAAPQPVAVSPAPVAPAPVVPTPVVAEAPQSTGTGLSGEALEKYLVNFVVEQTGYPEEMVELDADLEADLGIDSIKKAQLFGELANEFDIQTSEDLSLDDFPTLRDVKAFLEAAPQTTA